MRGLVTTLLQQLPGMSRRSDSLKYGGIFVNQGISWSHRWFNCERKNFEHIIGISRTHRTSSTNKIAFTRPEWDFGLLNSAVIKKPVQGEHHQFGKKLFSSLANGSHVGHQGALCERSISSFQRLTSKSSFPVYNLAHAQQLRTNSCCYSTSPSSSKGDTSPESSENANEAEQNEKSSDQSKPKSKTEELKIIFTQYGAFGVAFHIVMSLASLGFFYVLVSSGVDLVGLLNKVGIELSGVVSGASTFVVAYAVHKIALPVRASITIVSVPFLVRHLRKIGLFKK